MRVFEFVKEVKSEALKICWPSRKETTMAVGLVFVMATIAGLFFLVVDAVVYKVISLILGVGV